MSSSGRSGARAGKKGPAPKGGKRQSIRFRHDAAYNRLEQAYKPLGFKSFSECADYVFALALGQWKELGFRSAEEGSAYLAGLARGELVMPPHLAARAVQDALPLNHDKIAA